MKLRLRKASKSLKDKRLYQKYIESTFGNWLYLSGEKNSSTDDGYFDGAEDALDNLWNEYLKASNDIFENTDQVFFIEMEGKTIGLISFSAVLHGNYRVAEWTIEKKFFHLRPEMLDAIKEQFKERKPKNKRLCICTPIEDAGKILVDLGFETEGDHFFYLNF